MKYVIALVILLFPSTLTVFFVNIMGGKYRMGKNAKIGFSLILVNGFCIEEKVRIGHLNIIKGNINLRMECGAWMKNSNKISNNSLTTQQFTMRRESSIITHHVFDVSDSISIGVKSCLQGMEVKCGHILFSLVRSELLW